MVSAFEPFRPHYPPEAFQDSVPDPEAIRERMIGMTVYAALSDAGEVIGTIASAVEGERGHLRGMAVRPAWQGRGIAELLLHAAEKDLRAVGCTRVTLDTTAPLQRAIRFYQKNGFVLSDTIGDFFGMPLYEYAKSLI